jgi:hypothetical protein
MWRSLPTRVLAGPALRSALLASGLLAAAALVGATIRVLPWLLDPQLPLDVVRPFARSLAAISIEAALLTGWAIGFALASHRLAEREEARVLLLLGEAPRITVARLVPMCCALGLVLATASWMAGRDAREPGRVLTELIGRTEAACARAEAPTTYTVPFAEAVWLCAPGQAPRLVAHGPGSMRSAVVTAGKVRFSSDLRRMDVDDAKLLLGSTHVSVRTLVLRGLPPWGSASDLPTWLRALVMGAAGIGCALASAWGALILRQERPRAGRATAVVLGAAGPLAALGLLRALERGLPDAPSADGQVAALAPFALVPAAGVVSTLIVLGFLLRLPNLTRTDTREGRGGSEPWEASGLRKS